jgi:hypothetical protein
MGLFRGVMSSKTTTPADAEAIEKNWQTSKKIRIKAPCLKAWWQ